MAYMNILPDPVNKIKDSGIQNNSTGIAGPGFYSVKMASTYPVSTDRTNGGRVIPRILSSQYWEATINYNPLTRDEFEPVASFIFSKQQSLIPFYIILPQYASPRDSTFAAYAAGATILSNGVHSSGAMKMNIDGLSAISGSPKPGDMFNIVDSSNSNHVKIYRITRCETNGDYDTTQPTTAQRIIHFFPGLTYQVPDNTTVRFINPQMRVVSKGSVKEYEIDGDYLYQYSLNVEEALP